jgi:hypothetical protein
LWGLTLKTNVGHGSLIGESDFKFCPGLIESAFSDSLDLQGDKNEETYIMQQKAQIS